MNDPEERPEPPPRPVPPTVERREPADTRGPRTPWLTGGLRAAVFLKPRWTGVGVHPWTLVAVAFLLIAYDVITERLLVAGPARFHWPSWGTGWMGTVLLVAACALAARRLRGEPSRPDREPDTSRPDGTTLVTWALVVELAIGVPVSAAVLLLARGVVSLPPDVGGSVFFGLYIAAVAWQFFATTWLLMRSAPRRGVRVAVVLLMLMQVGANVVWHRTTLWFAAPPQADSASADPEPEPMRLTQDVLEAQSRVLIESLDAIAPQRPGVTELYAITFAPYADEDVFTRETAMVAGVMRDRFDAAGRVLNLQNHARSVGSAPWATPLNLQRALGRMAERMDPAEDILFLHLTSHGARDGKLSAGFFPLDVDEVTPQQLRRWLDDAGVRHAVISVSACFSGSWIEPLAGPGFLVMTAADATHTSYGCGRRSPLTFFGRAVYDEQLRKTRSFTAAFAAALPVIDRREKEAGKSDGPSNPQIRIGADIAAPLDALVRRLEDGPVAPAAPR